MSESGAVLAAVKGKSLRDGLRLPLTAAPRSAPTKSGRDEEMSQAIKQGDAAHNTLHSNRPIQVPARLSDAGPAFPPPRASDPRPKPFTQAEVPRLRTDRPPPTEAVWKVGEILQTIEQSKIFRDFFDSERSKPSQKRTKQARVKTRKSFYTASTQSGHLAGRSGSHSTT
jgi:hypothetical protein